MILVLCQYSLYALNTLQLTIKGSSPQKNNANLHCFFVENLI